MPVLIGVDPGLSGAAAIVERSASADRIVDVVDLPTIGEGASRRILVPQLMRFIIAAKAELAVIESVSAMPGQGLSSTFRFGRAVGAIEATIAAAGLPSRLVQPQAWKKHFSLRGPDKEPSRQLVISRMPQQTNYFARKADHGRAEAVLIGLYGLDLLERERAPARAA
jgi:crossover junction endodeoxyribonuclease RuvC